MGGYIFALQFPTTAAECKRISEGLKRRCKYLTAEKLWMTSMSELFLLHVITIKNNFAALP
jgi:hypothetical protein